MSLIVLPSNGPSGYTLSKSLRFRSSASAYLNRTPASAGNQKTWTHSVWVKRGKLGTSQRLLALNGSTDATYMEYGFSVGDDLAFGSYNTNFRITSQVFRDPSAWYHIVLAFDTTQATAANRVKLYVNGVQVTAFSTSNDPTLNTNYGMNYNGQTNIGFNFGSAYADWYMAELNFIDGQQLTASSFGSTNSLTGVWQPAKYTGTYGTNGFYLPFTNTTSTTTLGYDFSGNSNNWTTNNFSLTAGSTYDSMTDVPTLTSATTANYCVMNPLDKRSIVTVSNGNLNIVSDTSGSWGQVRATTASPSSGKWYWEVTASNVGEGLSIGLGNETTSLSLNFAPSSWANYYGLLNNGTLYYNNSSTSSYTSSFANGDVIMVAFDRDNSKIYFGKNGTWANSSNPATQTNPAASSISTSLTFFPMTGSSGFSPPIGSHNFGQQGFAYTPPTGFVALNTYNLPTSTIVQGNTVMDATLYTSNNSTLTVTNAGGFKPDLLWFKRRSGTGGNGLYNSVTTLGASLAANGTGVEVIPSPNDSLTAINSNGFTLGANNNSGAQDINYSSGSTFVAWQWQAGQGTNTTNTSGSITSTVSVNATAGFSVVTFAASASNTVGHGLGVAPSMIIIKSRTYVNDWICYHSALGATQYLSLNLTGAASTNSVVWNNTAPTSSVFTIGSGFSSGSYGNCVAYCWTPIAGYSAMGSYTGNGSTDGPFVYTGFRPKFILVKGTSASRGWEIYDTSRDTYNQAINILSPNVSDAEYSSSAYAIDILSNGFKLRNTNTYFNGSSETYIYMAFAENPFKNALAR